MTDRSNGIIIVLLSSIATNEKGDSYMNALEQKRREKGFTQAELAALLNVNQTAVSKWEIGKSLPQADKLPRLAQILDCTVDELLGPKGEDT